MAFDPRLSDRRFKHLDDEEVAAMAKAAQERRKAAEVFWFHEAYLRRDWDAHLKYLRTNRYTYEPGSYDPLGPG